MSPLAGALAMVTELTAGTVMAPFTLWLPWSPSAWLPRPRLALAPPQLRMVPLFRPKALAPMLTPLASASSATTT